MSEALKLAPTLLLVGGYFLAMRFMGGGGAPGGGGGMGGIFQMGKSKVHTIKSKVREVNMNKLNLRRSFSGKANQTRGRERDFQGCGWMC